MLSSFTVLETGTFAMSAAAARNGSPGWPVMHAPEQGAHACSKLPGSRVPAGTCSVSPIPPRLPSDISTPLPWPTTTLSTAATTVLRQPTCLWAATGADLPGNVVSICL